MRAWTVVIGLLLLGAVLCTWPVSVSAQSEPSAAAAQSSAAAAGPVAGQAATESGKATTDMQSFVGWIIRSSGAIGLFIFVLTVYFLITVFRLYATLRPEVAAPPDHLARLQELIDHREHRSVLSFARANDSYLCRVLTIGLLELPNGLEHARDTMERHGEAETVEMENRISMLAVLGTLGPMIGLIGTLKGMIASFSVIAMSEMQLRTSEVAGGISEALLLTFEGVALSVPAIYFFAVFRSRVSSISVGTMLQADNLLRQFATSVRVKSPAATSGTTSAAA